MYASPWIRSITLAILFTVGTRTVHAQVTAPPPPDQLGTTVGQILLTSELALDYQRDVTTTPPPPRPGGPVAESVTTTTYDLHLALDRVVWPRLVIGGRLGFDGTTSGLDARKSFDLGLRVGGLLPLGRSTIWWPSLGLGYRVVRFENPSSTTNLRATTLRVSAPFIWQPARHLMFGIGPTYARDLQSKTGPGADELGPKTSGFGLHGLLGMWF
jgi:hypothetical protein